MYYSGFLRCLVGSNEDVLLTVGGAQALGKIKTSVPCDDGLDEYDMPLGIINRAVCADYWLIAQNVQGKLVYPPNNPDFPQLVDTG